MSIKEHVEDVQKLDDAGVWTHRNVSEVMLRHKKDADKTIRYHADTCMRGGGGHAV